MGQTFAALNFNFCVKKLWCDMFIDLKQVIPVVCELSALCSVKKMKKKMQISVLLENISNYLPACVNYWNSCNEPYPRLFYIWPRMDLLPYAVQHTRFIE